MDLHKKIFTTELDGEQVSIEVSDLAGQANAAVIGRHGNTVVLATVVMSGKDKPGDFFPLTVDYEERFYAAGKIMGSRFVRREGKSSDESILSGRLIDRTVRPLFDMRLRREVQIVVTVLSYDGKNDPDVIGLLSASSALSISDIPWGGPVAGIQTIKKNDGGEEEYRSFFAGPEEYVNMIEFEGKEIQESVAHDVFVAAHKKIKELISFQKNIVKEIGKQKLDVMLKDPDSRIQSLVKEYIQDKIGEALRDKKFDELKNGLVEHLTSLGETEETLKDIELILETETDKFVHEEVIKHERRVDGRKLNEIRPLYGNVGLLELTHGSGLFIRGQTQVLAVTTLASSAAEQLVETMESTIKRRFMLHYNFPSFSTGEVGKSSRGPGRREIGHGALAAKALRALIPSKEEFPYTIRVVAETLSSNGSSSMASTCAGCLSLMDAGVPIKKHIGGVAMGLMTSEDGKEYKILTDIQGPEDHYGDMDFKVAGTRDGITAIQMDVKINGITSEIFEKALAQAKEGRFQIISVMEKAIPAARTQVSKYAPKIMSLMIPVDRIGELIGPGGKNINGIVAASEDKITIDIEEDGKVYIAGVDIALVERAYNTIQATMKEFVVGEMVSGPIVRILEFGAIVDLGGGQDGMIHVSELKDGFVKKVEDVVHVGDIVKAKVIRVEEGRIGLSIKALNKQ
jgi:polyribonucleotide nucleotidyltransferase